jgi:hypothetical protein
VAVTQSVANHHASLPIAYRLYLPKIWADDAARRHKAHVPEAIGFKTKPQIALAQIGAALAAGVAPGVVLMDASYGTNGALRASIGGRLFRAIVELGRARALVRRQSASLDLLRLDSGLPNDLYPFRAFGLYNRGGLFGCIQKRLKTERSQPHLYIRQATTGSAVRRSHRSQSRSQQRA